MNDEHRYSLEKPLVSEELEERIRKIQNGEGRHIAHVEDGMQDAILHRLMKQNQRRLRAVNVVQFARTQKGVVDQEFTENEAHILFTIINLLDELAGEG